MSETRRVAVVGATGFVGFATVRALEAHGHDVVMVGAPRLVSLTEAEAVPYIEAEPPELGHLVDRFGTVDAVINAAGLAAATSGDVGQLISANGVLPGLIAAAVRKARIPRFVHVSSAAVQGRRPVLDESDNFDDFSAYSSSKRLGEQLTRQFSDGISTVYRPAGVHGADRAVTRFSARIAASPIASVARPSDAPSPQALIGNVADAIRYLATCTLHPPRTVIHPWEGLSASDVMLLLGNRKPLVLPRQFARAVVATGTVLGRAVPWVGGNVRRLEMMWFGQAQAESWLTLSGWSPPHGRSAWAELGKAVRAAITDERSERKARA